MEPCGTESAVLGLGSALWDWMQGKTAAGECVLFAMFLIAVGPIGNAVGVMGSEGRRPDDVSWF